MPLSLLEALKRLARAAKQRDPVEILKGKPKPLPWWI
jgi:hypothetical protein